MDRSDLTDWIGRYEALWRTAGTDKLAELFTEDASYSMGPYEETQHGLDAIATLWEAERASADEAFRMTSAVVAIEGDTAVCRVAVHYDDPPQHEYKDLWIVRLDESGRCTHFEEWPFWPDRGPYPKGVEGGS
jgi:SnoaL-like protein